MNAEAHLESVLGATPQEFESPILRHPDLQEHRRVAATKQAPYVKWAHLMGSFHHPWSPPLPEQPLRCSWSAASRTILNGGAHAVKACGYPSGLAGTVRDGQIPGNCRSHHTE